MDPTQHIHHVKKSLCGSTVTSIRKQKLCMMFDHDENWETRFCTKGVKSHIIAQIHYLNLANTVMLFHHSQGTVKPSYIILCIQATASTSATTDKVGLTMVQSYNIHNQNVFYEHFCSFRNMQKLNSIISSSLIYLFVRVRNIYVYL